MRKFLVPFALAMLATLTGSSMTVESSASSQTQSAGPQSSIAGGVVAKGPEGMMINSASTAAVAKKKHRRSRRRKHSRKHTLTATSSKAH